MDGAKERGGRKRADEGGSNGAREKRKGERGRKGDLEGGELQGIYPDEDNSRERKNNTQRGPCICDFGITGI